jgi:hypothetical protein
VIRPELRGELDAHRFSTIAAARHRRALRHVQTRTPAAFENARQPPLAAIRRKRRTEHAARATSRDDAATHDALDLAQLDVALGTGVARTIDRAELSTSGDRLGATATAVAHHPTIGRRGALGAVRYARLTRHTSRPRRATAARRAAGARRGATARRATGARRATSTRRAAPAGHAAAARRAGTSGAPSRTRRAPGFGSSLPRRAATRAAGAPTAFVVVTAAARPFGLPAAAESERKAQNDAARDGPPDPHALCQAHAA